MADDPERTPREEQPDGDYPVLPPDPLDIDPLLFPESADLDELLDAAESAASDEDRLQFSLGEMFVAMFLIALFLGLGTYLPGEYGARRIAGLAGLGLVFYRVALVYFEPNRKIFYATWWVMLSFYVVICALAVATGL